MKQVSAGWDWVLITIHWLTALTVFSMFAVGLWMVDLNYYSDWYKTAPHWHKSIGLLLAGLTVCRVIWRLLRPRPPKLGSAFERAIASLVHLLIYLLLFSLFVSGYLISTADGRAIDVFDWFAVPSFGQLFDDQEDIAGSIHFYIAWTLIGLVSLHIVGALKHHFIDKDVTLKRMLGKKHLS
ncbi:cytochrome b [Alteromonas ponticola]|uniref:Cytochrome b n=1 Tax=Alteromonas aquimaris TaxID=2998417 RepID=A0ABT3P8M2_9ALTE|nr:cytochrome b [Alteromonas aquimaris]MCW8109120.1 cytochrome b [Alteromonas aquimaris]